jgi:hypothetical protein
LTIVQVWTTPPDVGVRGPLAPKPAVAERRAADVLPGDSAGRGAATWVLTLVVSAARTGWLAAVLTAAFLAGTFGATWARGRSMASAAPWALAGGAVWLTLALTWTFVRGKR